MKILFVVGEKSGDQHAGALLRVLLQLNPDILAFAVGGEELIAAKATLIKRYELVNYMGVWEVVKNLPKIQKQINEILSWIDIQMPDLIIHIDSYGLNKQIAKHVSKKGIDCLYYIAPKVWAWNTGRTSIIKRLFKKVFVIFPFERDFYERHGIQASYTGNPSFEAISKFRITNHLASNITKSYIALLPGSRSQEIIKNLPIMAAVAKYRHTQRFIVAGIRRFKQLYEEILSGCENIRIDFDDSFNVLNSASAAIVVSGTATFETALFEVPQIVIYKTSWLTGIVGRLVIKVPYISLVNLVANREVVKELIQNDCTVDNILKELTLIEPGGSKREAMLKDYRKIEESLGSPNASETAAREILNYINSKK